MCGICCITVSCFEEFEDSRPILEDNRDFPGAHSCVNKEVSFELDWNT